MRTLCSIFAITLFVSLPGCHCFRVSEHYADGIDDVADKCDFKRKLDDVYCERIDISRWCMNRRCPPSCCPQSRKPVYR